VEAWLDSVITDSVIQSYMLPEGLVVPLVDGDLGFVDVPKGILFVRLLEAVNVPKTDWLGKCDPYVVMWTRSTRKSKSPVKHNSYHPVWEDARSSQPYVFLVHDPDIQKLHVELFDWDVMGKEKVGIGETPPIKELPPGQAKDVWVELELETETSDPDDLGEKFMDTMGKIKQNLTRHRRKGPCKVHLEVTYQPLGSEEVKRIREGDVDEGEHEDDQVHDMLRGGVLYVYIKKAMHLVRHDFVIGKLVSHKSQVKVKVADQTQYSSGGRGKRGELTFDDRLEFILPGHIARNSDVLVHFEVRDYGFMNTFQGRLDIPLVEVERHRHLKGDYPLDGVKEGTLKLELQWVGILEGG
jgi:hypothetical protein